MEMKCSKCNKIVSQKVADYSEKNCGKIICYECQKGGGNGKATENTPTAEVKKDYATVNSYQDKQANREDRIELLACLKVAGHVLSNTQDNTPTPAGVVMYAEQLVKEIRKS